MKQIKINIDTAQLVQNKLNVTSFTEIFLYLMLNLQVMKVFLNTREMKQYCLSVWKRSL